MPIHSHSFATMPLLVSALLALTVASGPANGAERAQGAEAYYEQIARTVAGIQADLPAITTAAGAAARLYVNENYHIGADGDTIFVSEAGGRSGGLMSLEARRNFDDPAWQGIILYALREPQLDEDLAKITRYRQRGSKVVLFARRELLDKAKLAGATFDWTVENHAAAHGGLFMGGAGEWLVPTEQPASIAALWTWAAEFVAACTRLGKMPTMYQGFLVPGGRERAQKIGKAKFHDTTPAAIKAGQLGTEYLRVLRQNLTALHNEMNSIRNVARMAVQARATGHGVYAFFEGHAIYNQLESPHDPGYFKRINELWNRKPDPLPLKPEDFVLGVGYDTLFHGAKWDDFAEHARAAGAHLAWSFIPYYPDEVKAIAPGEIYIDQHWAFGDADVVVPGYDIKIIPTSGVLAETVLLMVEAEMYQQLKRTTAPGTG